jgi:ferredoxin
VLDPAPPTADRDHVHAAVQACPVLALSLLEA